MRNDQTRQRDFDCRINSLERIVGEVERKCCAIINANGSIGEVDCLIRNCEINARADNQHIRTDLARVFAARNNDIARATKD